MLKRGGGSTRLCWRLLNRDCGNAIGDLVGLVGSGGPWKVGQVGSAPPSITGRNSVSQTVWKLSPYWSRDSDINLARLTKVSHFPLRLGLRENNNNLTR